MGATELFIDALESFAANTTAGHARTIRHWAKAFRAAYTDGRHVLPVLAPIIRAAYHAPDDLAGSVIVGRLMMLRAEKHFVVDYF